MLDGFVIGVLAEGCINWSVFICVFIKVVLLGGNNLTT